ncbi:MAG: hypothetical protein K6E50_14140 [Lachnospiraceae bacterium]|nr:hypothetical protein [Lachnospiraceae bacterium]
MPLCIALFFLAGNALLGSLLQPLGTSRYFRDEVAVYAAEGKQADIVFLGSSRTFQTYAPEVLERELGLELVINAGSATQRPESSYYLLKDLYRQVKPKVVVWGVQWNMLLKEATESQRLESAITAYDRMSARGRIEYIPTYMFTDLWPQFLDVYRYRNDFRYDAIRKNLEAKAEYKEHGFIPDTEADHYYAGKGFTYSNTHCEDGNVPIMDEGGQIRFSAEEIDPEKLRYLEKVTKFCEKNGIRLYLVASPIAVMNLYHLEGYQEANDYYADFAEKHGIVFYNLNYLKDKEELFPDHMQCDYVHLSGEGAEAASALFAELLRMEANGESTDGLFYDDLSEVKAQIRRIAAVKADIEREGTRAEVSVLSLHNEDVVVRYKAEYAKEGEEEFVLLRDWSEGEEFELALPSASGGRLRISAWSGVEGEGIAWQEYVLE